MPSIPWKEMALAAVMGAAAPALALAQPASQAQSSAFTDAELTAFAKARAEIQPIQLAEITASQSNRLRDEAQITAALTRNGLTREDYDAIATVAMADAGLSARIAQLAEVTDTPQGA